MRSASLLLAERRRGFGSDQSIELPIPLDIIQRTKSREEAKRALGIDPDDVVLLTIASDYKYRSNVSTTFPIVIGEIIRKYPTTRLIAIGPSATSDWEQANALTKGRVQALGPRTDTRTFYEAADIYLDSFPFASNTSLLEAGSYGQPLVSFSPYRGVSSVLGPGCPGLTGCLQFYDALGAYRARIEELIEDPDLRQKLGARTSAEIMKFHCGDAWRETLESAYSHAMTRPRLGFTRPIEACQPNEGPDLAISWMLRQGISLKTISNIPLRSLNYLPRLRTLLELRSVTDALPLDTLLPRSLETRISQFLHRIKRPTKAIEKTLPDRPEGPNATPSR